MALLLLQIALAVPVFGGTAYGLLCSWAAWKLRRERKRLVSPSRSDLPPVTILKPLCGMERGLEENLRSTCIQDYPQFQVVISVQRPDDTALPIARKIEKEFGPDRVTVVVEDRSAGTNGKINNLLGAVAHARHDVFVISDSDVVLRPDYLRTIVPPLLDSGVGCSCTLYRAAGARSWFEKTELLTLNGEFVPNLVFARATGASNFCLGASTAITRKELDAIGGFAALAEYLVEDYEMGRRLWTSGRQVRVVPYFVDMGVDLRSPRDWWRHLVYWDKNTRAARPVGFLMTALVRAIPFGLLFAAVRRFDAVGLGILGGAIAMRLLTTAFVLTVGLDDREGLGCLWLMPFRDLAGLGAFVFAFGQRTIVWRGAQFRVSRDGRLVAEGAA